MSTTEAMEMAARKQEELKALADQAAALLARLQKLGVK
jgi:prephenate dehydratase